MASNIFKWFEDDEGDAPEEEADRPPETDETFGGFEEFDDPGQGDPFDDGGGAGETPDDSGDTTGSGSGSDSDSTTLERRVDGLEDDLESVDDRLTDVRDSQDAVANQVEEVNDRVRRLVGLYDQAAADSNPFAGDDDGFGVVGDPDPALDSDLEADREAEKDAEDETVSPETDPDSGGRETVDYEDLVTGAEPENRTESGTETEDEPPEEGPMRTDSARADRFDTGVDGTTGFENGGSGDDVFGDGTALDGPATGSDAEQFDTTENGREGDEPLLAVLGENYASTVIGFGWLSDMVAVGGPAGALRALDHYETIGWLGPEARAELESMLSGPGLDVDIDPNEPKELTAEEHALSYEYVRMLEAVDTLEDSF